MLATQTPASAPRGSTPRGTEATIQKLLASIRDHEASIQNHKASIQSHEDSIQAIRELIESLQSNAQTPEATTEKTVQDIRDEDTEFGDFVKDAEEEADVEFENEPWDSYAASETTELFYPVYIGELLNGRYLVEHKLGRGGFSTVWMAHDIQDGKDVALKVLSLGGYDTNETRIQTEIRQHIQERSHLLVALDTFVLPREDNATFHTIHVLPLMGPNLSWNVMQGMSMTTRMSAALQLLKALEALHKAGIVHRDLSDGNCMWGLQSLSGLSRAEKYEKLNRPLKMRIPYVEPELWKKGELVRPAEIPTDLRTDDFFLGDFGISTKLGDPTYEAKPGFPPPLYCSPERLHNEPPSFACDMWSYMIVFSELYLDFPPFYSTAGGGIIGDLFKILGPLPARWKGLCDHPIIEDSWYEDSEEPFPDMELKERITLRRPEMDEAEKDLATSVLRKVFVYSPEKRLSATQLLEDSDFKALMQKYGC
ncbi:hypothetical protein PITC_080710 [Penicillium italicum]|uniref:Protein kinase domain-containing protein n=1 Tax=Penicillium italicum TaxID=40296 RepID=A0A0A2L2Z3_PENIT|nr:hypothetical protein PITC_080710 [Penicillium italicum]